MSTRRTFVPPPGVLMPRGSMEPCDTCGTMVTRKPGGYYSVHMIEPRSSTPCPRSWPGSKPPLGG